MEFLTVENGVICRNGTPFLLRGFGLGGWLLPEGYMWKLFTKCDRPRRMEALIQTLCGQEYAEGFWQKYNDTYITRAEIEYIAKCGFNSVRLPLNARHLCHDENGSLVFTADTIGRVDDCIRWCREFGLYVVLDMHAAPGGQTGQNIDDSENDKPELFLHSEYTDTLTQLWVMLARRYRDEAAVAGYDLLNEPLPNWNAQYNYMVLPLYRRLMAAIRQVDDHHLMILEGVHWATDFSIFDAMTPEEEAENHVVLQFHKYWNNPDADSLTPFLECAKRLNAPLYLGESGENNLDWYTTVFPLCERLGIGWSFWAFKKMDNRNSPITFAQPGGWDTLIKHLDGNGSPTQAEAQALFDRFLACIASPIYCDEVMRALSRTSPVVIPAEAFDECDIHSAKESGADLRQSEPVTLLFADGHTGTPDYRRYAGEPQPETERIVVRLLANDSVRYRFSADHPSELRVICHGTGSGTASCGSTEVFFSGADPVLMDISNGKNQTLTIRCTDGLLLLDQLELKNKEHRS